MYRLGISIFIAISMFLPQLVLAQVVDAIHLEEKDIINAIRQEFSDQGMAEIENVDVELFGGQTDFQIEKAQEVKILINDFNIDENLGRFSCEVEIFADRQPYANSQIQGKYFLLSTVWVPAQNIAKGEIISEDMLVSKFVRQSKLKSFAITEKDNLVGKETRKSLKEGRIINEKDIGSPILIKKDSIVLVIYRTEKMQITTKAIAQQDGAKGDRIKLENMKTRKPLTGIVQDKSTVIIDQ